jgi:predicted NAD/FAD-dependent oxidoreductase
MTTTADIIETIDIAIIGSGIAGLACAHRLAQAGHSPMVLDKGRGLGGRVATRRAEGFQFDHGAQYVTAKTPLFSEVIQNMRDTGAAADWAIDSHRPRTVGTPGMSSLAKALAASLDIRQGVQVTNLTATPTGWRLQMRDARPIVASRVVITAPAPQIPALLEDGHPFLPVLAQVVFAPCLTLMAAIKEHDAPFIAREDATDEMSWISQDSSKPGRTSSLGACWVAQAGPSFSQAHLEEEPSAMTTRMLPMLCQRIGASLDQVVYATTHRWRYARVSVPLGEPFLRSDDERLYCGGDWCLGPRVEAAWQSGMAMAEDILLRTPTDR